MVVASAAVEHIVSSGVAPQLFVFCPTQQHLGADRFGVPHGAVGEHDFFDRMALAVAKVVLHRDRLAGVANDQTQVLLHGPAAAGAHALQAHIVS
ncbi:hypothetical protein D9M68_957890 [compost metagenome]